MTSDENERDQMPDTEELEEPSTEKAPEEQPTSGDDTPEPSHEAVGIGIVDRPQVGLDDPA